MLHDKIETTCSCGKSTMLTFDESMTSPEGFQGAYVPDDPAFTWVDEDGIGWYCGMPGHKMATLAGMSRKQYAEAIMKAMIGEQKNDARTS